MASSTAEPEGYPEAEVNPEPEAHPETAAEPDAIAEVFTERETTLWLTCYIFWICLIVILNICTISALIRSNDALKQVSNMFLLSLIVARTSVALLVMPVRITGLFSSEAIGPYLCKLCHFAGQGSAGSSVFSTCSVAIAKLIEVKYSRKNFTQKHGLIGIILVWILGHLYAIRAYFLNNLVLVDTMNGPFWACTADMAVIKLNQIFIFVDLTVLFIIPVLLVLICYCQVLAVLRKSMSKHILMDTVLQKSDMTLKIKTPSAVSLSDKEEKRTVKNIQMLIAVMLIFCLSYAAVYIWKMYLFFSGINVFTGHFLHLEQFVYLVSYANPWVNVFVYVYFRDDIRNNFCPFAKKRTLPIITD